MTLHDRIMAINVQSDRKRSDVRSEAADMAKEADELIAEMADALDCYADVPYISGPARAAIEKYNTYKERSQ